MKWGVRRYQNKDGTLTSAGKKRYKLDGKNTISSLARVRNSVNKQLARLSNTASTLKERRYQKLVGKASTKYVDSTKLRPQDLRDIVSQLQMEKQYKDLMENLGRKKNENRQKSEGFIAHLLKTTIEDVVKTAATTKVRQAMEKGKGKGGGKKEDEDDD